MSITASNIIPLSLGSQTGVIADLAISANYAEGGLALDTLALLGIHTPNKIVMENKKGLSLEYDYTNNKIKMFNPNVPLIVYDEKQVCPAGSYVITLNYPAAFIMNVAKPGQNLALRSTGVTPGASQCSLPAVMSAGVRTQITLGTTTLLVNGTFTGNATGWTPEAAAWTYGTNNVNKDANGTGTLAEDAFAATIGETYELTYTISSWSVGSVTPTVGGVAGTAVSADGTYTERFTATTAGGMIFTPTNTARFTIDTVVLTQMSAKVTYITQAWKEVWDNLVQDEALTLATGANTLTSGNKILAVMYMDQITATAAVLLPVDEDDTAASGELEVAFNATTAQLTAHSNQNAKAIKLTYLKVPSSGFLKDRLFHNETATKAANGATDGFINTFTLPILIWGYAGYAPSNGGATQALIDFAGTPAAGEEVIDWFNPGTRQLTLAPSSGTKISGVSDLALTGAGVWGTINEVNDRQPLELLNGTAVSMTNVRVLVIGY
jgi:hypothetical protein